MIPNQHKGAAIPYLVTDPRDATAFRQDSAGSVARRMSDVNKASFVVVESPLTRGRWLVAVEGFEPTRYVGFHTREPASAGT